MDYQFASQLKYLPGVMHLRIPENINGKSLMKIGTLTCFLLAGSLLIASLFVPPPAQSGAESGVSLGTTASVR